MGKRVFDHSREHPEDTTGFAATVTRLGGLLSLAAELAAKQQEGLIEEHAATGIKHDLRVALKQGHLDHVARVGRVASAEVPELRQKFGMGRGTSFMAFRTTAGRIAADALANKDVLVQNGLSETVLNGLGQLIAKYDAALDQASSGKRAHTGASAELEKVAREIVQAVKVMDGLNRARFEKGSDPLGAWVSARSGASVPHPAPDRAPAAVPAPATSPVTGAEDRPAA